MAVDGAARNLIDTYCARAKCRNSNRRRDESVDLSKQLQKRRPQARPPVTCLDVVSAAIAAAFRDDLAIIFVGCRQGNEIAIGHSRRLFRIGDRLQNSLQHVRCKSRAVRHNFGAECRQRRAGSFECVTYLRIHGGIAEIDAGPDFQTVETIRRYREPAGGHWQARRVTKVMGRNHLQQQRSIGDCPRDWPGVGQRGP